GQGLTRHVVVACGAAGLCEPESAEGDPKRFAWDNRVRTATQRSRAASVVSSVQGEAVGTN
ncbi:MAG: hypothetical protein OEV01_14725, partial [Nitrospira sp.]|nr:hypothetical protein [Nitrospira sp.]